MLANDIAPIGLIDQSAASSSNLAFPRSVASMSEYVHLRGCEAILERKDELTAFGQRIGIRDAGAQIEAILTEWSEIPKVPHLIFCTSETGRYAILMREYKLRGFPSRVLFPVDSTGELTLLAPVEEKVRVGLEVLDYMLSTGAFAVLLSIHGVELTSEVCGVEHFSRFATSTRRLRRSVPLKATLDETLGQFGARTRRNLRHYARLATDDLNAVFVEDPQLTEEEFVRLNSTCSHAVSEEEARSRYRLSKTPNRFFVTLVSDGNQTISALGGRRFPNEERSIVDWQLNHKDLKDYSLSTAMRYFYFQHEIDYGTKLLSFEGGTTHSMQNGFIEEAVIDVLAARWPVSPRLLRRAIARVFPNGDNCIASPLISGRESWQ